MISDEDDSDAEAMTGEKRAAIRESAEILEGAISRAFVFARRYPGHRWRIQRERISQEHRRGVTARTILQKNHHASIIRMRRLRWRPRAVLRIAVQQAKHAIREGVRDAVEDRSEIHM